MRSFDRYSEPYGPTGNLTAQGALNPLGRPDLDVPVVLVREAAQNSWDARLSDKVITFGLAGWELTTEQRQVLESTVFRDSPRVPSIQSQLKKAPSVSVLAVYDRGTAGLGGPTRADKSTSDSEASDFVDFLRNIGQAPSKPLSGGTYGFGKAAFYRASSLHTILVHTRCAEKKRLESRLIAAGLGTPYTQNGKKYTGRHWWGRNDEDGIAEPLLNLEADQLAEALELPSFEERDTGTTIVVIQPRWDDRTPKQFMNLMAEALLWYFWPKMLNDSSGFPPMQFNVSWNQEPIFIPYPGDYPPLQGYVQAMEQLRAGEVGHPSTGALISVQAASLKRQLGMLSLYRYPVYERRTIFDTGPESCRPFIGRSCHTALMRQAELVVKYLPGQPLSADILEYAGVFITDRDVDEVFAEAEPPAHDNWTASSLGTKEHRTIVNRAIEGIKGAMKEFAHPSSNYNKQPTLVPLGAFANALGRLLPGQDGPSATVRPFGTQRSNSPTTPTPPTPPPANSEVSTGSESNQPYSPIDFSFPSGGMSYPPEVASGETHQGNRGDFETPFRQGPSESTSTLPAGGTSANNGEQGASSRGKAKAILLDEGLLTLYDDQPVLRLRFDLSHAQNSLGTDIAVRVAVVLDENELEDEPPLGTEIPQVLKLIGSDGSEYEGSNLMFIPAEYVGEWHILISVPENTEVGVNLTAQARFES